MDKGGEGEMGQRWIRQVRGEKLVGTEPLLWEAAENNGLGEERVNTARAQSPSPAVQWMEREKTRGRLEQKVKGFFRWACPPAERAQGRKEGNICCQGNH